MNLTLLLVGLLVFCLRGGARAQNTVDINPQNDINIPIISNLINAGKEKPLVSRWSFWLGIALCAAFFIVVGYFSYRGFKTHFKIKKERQLELAKSNAAQGQLPPLAKEGTCEVDIHEIARRTGHRHEHVLEKLESLATRHISTKASSRYSAPIRTVASAPAPSHSTKDPEKAVPENWNCIQPMASLA